MTFDKLTPTQLAVFEQVAVGNDAGHPVQTLRSLVKLGLLRRYDQCEHDAGFRYNIKRYYVPIHVHIEWCAWCSDEHCQRVA